eukprot:scaffold27456_cov56-Cyclotella_meneghiniana.AAC.3
MKANGLPSYKLGNIHLGKYLQFAEGATAEEQRLVNAFTLYFTFYANLPKTPTLPDNAPDGFDMSTAEEKVNNLLSEFEHRLGDPLAQCDKCKKCALGKKMMRCSQCHLALYCTRECQRQHLGKCTRKFVRSEYDLRDSWKVGEIPTCN